MPIIAYVFSMHLVAQIQNFSLNYEHFSINTGFLTLCMLGNLVPENKIFKGVLPYMGVVAILVM